MADILPRGLFEPIRLPRLFNEPFFRSAFGVEEGTLPLDISQSEENLIVRASLPGCTKEDIEVQIHNGTLSITAQAKEEKEVQGERFYRRERRMGSVSRRVALPGLVSGAKASAKFQNGVLTLRISLSDKEKPNQVSIE